jgi:hypothetical protein
MSNKVKDTTWKPEINCNDDFLQYEGLFINDDGIEKRAFFSYALVNSVMSNIAGLQDGTRTYAIRMQTDLPRRRQR